MSKPKHRRCGICNVVTSRYVRTVQQGPFTFKVWEKDSRNGEVVTDNGRTVRCTEHSGVDNSGSAR
jgi:hypothetical protein